MIHQHHRLSLTITYTVFIQQLYMCFHVSKPQLSTLYFEPQVAQLPLEVRDGRWHHICISWTTRDGQWEAYQDGGKLGAGDNLAAWHPIKPGGVIILGQEQVWKCSGTPCVRCRSVSVDLVITQALLSWPKKAATYLETHRQRLFHNFFFTHRTEH